MFYVSREMKDFLETIGILKNSAMVLPVMLVIVLAYFLLAGVISLLG